MRDTSLHKEKKLCAPPDQRLPRSYPLLPSTPAERALQVPLLSKAASCLEPPTKTQLMLLADPDTTWYFNTCSGGCSGGPCGQHLSCVTAREGQMLFRNNIDSAGQSVSPSSCYSYFVYLVALYSPTAEKFSPQLDRHVSIYQQQREEKALDLSKCSQVSTCDPVSPPQWF